MAPRLGADRREDLRLDLREGEGRAPGPAGGGSVGLFTVPQPASEQGQGQDGYGQVAKALTSCTGGADRLRGLK